MTITRSYILHSDVSIENSQEWVLKETESPLEFKQIETNINKVLEIFYSSIDFSPLVNFINKENPEFEALLNEAEKKQISNSDRKPQRNIEYNLRYRPYRSFQKQSDSSEDKKQQVLALTHSGIAKAAIAKDHGIPLETLKEWCRLSTWHELGKVIKSRR